MTKTKKQLKLEPLTVGETIDFPCTASLKILSTGDIVGAKLYAGNHGGVLNEYDEDMSHVSLYIRKSMIPLLIKTLRRAQKTK